MVPKVGEKLGKTGGQYPIYHYYAGNNGHKEVLLEIQQGYSRQCAYNLFFDSLDDLHDFIENWGLK